MFRPDVALSEGVDSDSHVHRAGYGIDFDRRLRRSRDRDVASSAEYRRDIRHCAANLNSIEQSRRLWHGDGGEDAQDAQRDSDFSYRERLSLRRLTSLGLSSWIAYGRYVLCR